MHINLFILWQLTFDDFNKQVGVYDESSSELEEAVQKSASSYWAGIRDTGTGDWVSRLASSRGTTVHRIRGERGWEREREKEEREKHRVNYISKRGMFKAYNHSLSHTCTCIGSIRNRLNLNGVIVVELDSVDNQGKPEYLKHVVLLCLFTCLSFVVIVAEKFMCSQAVLSCDLFPLPFIL